jgi:hypothetical protein
VPVWSDVPRLPPGPTGKRVGAQRKRSPMDFRHDVVEGPEDPGVGVGRQPALRTPGPDQVRQLVGREHGRHLRPVVGCRRLFEDHLDVGVLLRELVGVGVGVLLLGRGPLHQAQRDGVLADRPERAAAGGGLPRLTGGGDECRQCDADPDGVPATDRPCPHLTSAHDGALPFRRILSPLARIYFTYNLAPAAGGAQARAAVLLWSICRPRQPNRCCTLVRRHGPTRCDGRHYPSSPRPGSRLRGARRQVKRDGRRSSLLRRHWRAGESAARHAWWRERARTPGATR